MALGALAAEVALLDHLLGVVPGTAGIGHEDRQHEARTEAADQQAHDARHAEDEADNHRHDDGQQAREEHLTLRPARRDGHAARIVGRTLAREDSLDLAELAPHLLHHALGRAAHGVHRQAAEEERHHRADEDADEHRGVHQRDVIVGHEVEDRGLLDQALRPVGEEQFGNAVVQQADADLLDVGGQQRQRREGRRTDGKALARGGRRVAQRVEGVGTLAHLGTQTAHLGVAAGVVGDGPVGVGGQRDAQCREHAHGGDADAVEALREVLRRHHVVDVEADGAKVGQDDGHADRHDGDGRGDHSRADAGDDDRCGAGLRAAGDLLRRTVGVRGVVLGGLSDHDASHEARDDREGEPHPVLDAQQIEDTEGGQGDQQRAEIDAHAQRAEQLAHRGPLLRAHEEDADDREQDAHGGDQHRGQHGLELQGLAAGRGEGCGAERRGGQHRTAVALVEVGAHAGHVTHVITHVVGNRRRIARVVLGDAGLDLAHQVGAHVGSLRVDAAADTGEEGLRRGSHAEGQHRRGDDDQLLRSGHIGEVVEDQVPERDIEQAEAHDDQSHDGAAAEGDLQAAVERLARRMGRAGRGVGCGLHAEETRKPREEPARQEGEGHPRVLHAGTVGQVGEQKRQGDEDDRDDLVLLAQIGHRPLADMCRDLTHALRALVLTLHPRVEDPRHGQCNDRGGGHDPENQRCVHCGSG